MVAEFETKNIKKLSSANVYRILQLFAEFETKKIKKIKKLSELCKQLQDYANICRVETKKIKKIKKLSELLQLFAELRQKNKKKLV